MGSVALQRAIISSFSASPEGGTHGRHNETTASDTVAASSLAAGLFAFPSHGAGQAATCDADLLPSLPLPELRISAPKAELRVAPKSDGKVVITLPQDVEVPVLGRHNGWFAVNYLTENRYRRLYMSAAAAEPPPTTDYGPGHAAAQRWSTSHSRICGKISGARTATISFVGAALLAGTATLVWKVVVDKEIPLEEDGYYAWSETGNSYLLAIWAGIGVGALAGAVYQGIRLRRANNELADLGWPSLNNGGVLLPGLGRARGDLVYHPATGRRALVVNWQP